jgi:hypothetical protein
MYYYDQRVKLICDVGDGIDRILAGRWGNVHRLYSDLKAVDVRFDNRRGVHKILQKHLVTAEHEVECMRQRLGFSVEEISNSSTILKAREEATEQSAKMDFSNRRFQNSKPTEVKSPELHRAEMLDSYMLAVAECGGSAATFVSKIETMTVKEMIDTLAQNGVRFTTDRKGVPKT